MTDEEKFRQEQKEAFVCVQSAWVTQMFLLFDISQSTGAI